MANPHPFEHFLPSRRNRRRPTDAGLRRGTSNRRLQVEALEDRRLLVGAPQLVKDINTTPSLESSNPTQLTEVGGIVFFTAETTTTGSELW